MESERIAAFPALHTGTSLRGATVRSRLLTQANLGTIRSHDLIVVDANGKREHRRFPGSPHSPLASRRDSKVATPHASAAKAIRSHDLIVVEANGKRENRRHRHRRERRAPARQGEGIADEEPHAKLGLGVLGNLTRLRPPRFAARQ